MNEPTYDCDLRGHLVEEKTGPDGEVQAWCVWCSRQGTLTELTT